MNIEEIYKKIVRKVEGLPTKPRSFRFQDLEVIKEFNLQDRNENGETYMARLNNGDISKILRKDDVIFDVINSRTQEKEKLMIYDCNNYIDAHNVILRICRNTKEYNIGLTQWNRDLETYCEAYDRVNKNLQLASNPKNKMKIYFR